MKKGKSIFGDQKGEPGVWKLIKFRRRVLSPEIEGKEKERLFLAIADTTVLNRTSSFKKYWYVAASILFLMMIGSGALFFSEKSFETNYGQITTIRLPDGSKVTLNGNSSISYAPYRWDFFNERKVSLEGEAFFDVVKKEHDGNDVKFKVTTENIKVEVLGTRFNVAERGGLDEVILEEGSVQVIIPQVGLPVLMEPGDFLSFDQTNNQFSQRIVNTEEYTSWKDKYILLDNKTLGEVASIISAVYGKQVIFENPVDKTIELRGKVPSDEVQILIAALRLATKLDIKLEGDIVTVKNSETKITK